MEANSKKTKNKKTSNYTLYLQMQQKNKLVNDKEKCALLSEILGENT